MASSYIIHSLTYTQITAYFGTSHKPYIAPVKGFLLKLLGRCSPLILSRCRVNATLHLDFTDVSLPQVVCQSHRSKLPGAVVIGSRPPCSWYKVFSEEPWSVQISQPAMIMVLPVAGKGLLIWQFLTRATRHQGSVSCQSNGQLAISSSLAYLKEQNKTLMGTYNRDLSWN